MQYRNPDTSESQGHVPERGSLSRLNIAAAVLVGLAPAIRRVFTVTVVTAGSTPGTVNDVATTGAAAAGNQVFSLPNTVGSYIVDWPILVGLVLVPGTGQVLAVSYS